MSVRAARRLKTTTFLVSARLSLAGLFLLGASNALQTAIAEGDTRTLSFHHLHTNEDITITYKRNGRYDEAALKKLNWFMRDWRKDEEVRMDPHLFDLLWETYREVGATQPIQVIGGYRSPATNAMLRARSSGVAEVSQHSAGNAMDFFIPGVPLAKIREVGLRMQRGGVGFYPTSGSPFVHMDTGTVRHWPRMTYAQLEKVFPNGRTVHVSSDGRPLPGYALALADVERRGNTPNHVSLEAARSAGAITAQQEAEATTVAAAHKQQPSRNLFASLFGFGKKNTEETGDNPASTTTAAKSTRARTVVASAAPPMPVATERIVPLPAARPQMPVAVASAEPQQATYQTASAAFDSRGVWPAVVDQTAANKNDSPFAVDDPATTGTAPPLAYAAADSEPAPVPRARPMGRNVPQIAKESTLVPAQTAAAMPQTPLLTAGSQRPNSPWLRAAMLTPSVSTVMRATQIGTFDPRPLQHLLYKPTDALTTSFSADPSLGMLADRFSGPAVVFVATTTFVSAKTAALR